MFASIGLISRICFPLPVPRLSSQLPIEQWITPKEQLKRLRAPIANEVDDRKILISELADLVASYAVDPALAHWYTAYTELKPFSLFSEKVPPLPDDICTEAGKWQEKGLRPVLYFVPGGTLNELMRATQAYWEATHPGEENSLKFSYIWRRNLEKYGNVRVEAHWALMSDVLPETRNKSYDQQIAWINALNLQCEVPRLYSVVGVMFQHKIATGEWLYPEGNAQNGDLWTYTRVQEIRGDGHLVVGGFAPSGVHVDDDEDVYNAEDIGVAALRKF